MSQRVCWDDSMATPVSQELELNSSTVRRVKEAGGGNWESIVPYILFVKVLSSNAGFRGQYDE